MAAGPKAWAAARPRLVRGALALACGLVAGLGHAPYDLPYLALFGFAGVVWLWRDAGTAGRAALFAWAAGVGYFGLTLAWIVEPFLVDIARHGVFAPFAIFGMSAGLALFWALAGWIAARFARWHVAGFAAALTLAELARSVVLTGFPWALPAYIWTDTPLAQSAALLGPHGLTLVTLALAGSLALLRPVPVAAAVLGLAVLWGHGALRLDAPAAPPGPVVRLVQPNAPQHLKWRRDMIPVFYERQLAASAAPADPRPDVIIWPEAAVPVLLGMRPEIEAEIAAAGQGAQTIIGIRRYDEQARWYNALAAFAPDGALMAQYDKHHLVPFGEYMPAAPLLERLGLSALTEGLVGGYSAGPGPERIALPGLPAFQPLICYEAIFPHEILRGPDRPGWLVQITNDAWFGTHSGPYQHLAQARMRAIEQGLPLARAANTGISAMIDPYGRMVGALPLGTQGFLDVALPTALPPTLYARSGDLPAALAALLLLGLGRLLRRQAG